MQVQIESCQFQGYAPSQGGALELRILADRAAPSALPGPVAQGVVANVPVTIVGGNVLNVPVVTLTSLLDATAALDRGLVYAAQIWQGGVFREHLRGLEQFRLLLPGDRISWLEIHEDNQRLKQQNVRGAKAQKLFSMGDLDGDGTRPNMVHSAVTVLGARTTSETETNIYLRCYDEEIGPYLRYNAADDRWETAGLNGVPQALGSGGSSSSGLVTPPLVRISSAQQREAAINYQRTTTAATATGQPLSMCAVVSVSLYDVLPSVLNDSSLALRLELLRWRPAHNSIKGGKAIVKRNAGFVHPSPAAAGGQPLGVPQQGTRWGPHYDVVPPRPTEWALTGLAPYYHVDLGAETFAPWFVQHTYTDGNNNSSEGTFYRPSGGGLRNFLPGPASRRGVPGISRWGYFAFRYSWRDAASNRRVSGPISTVFRVGQVEPVFQRRAINPGDRGWVWEVRPNVAGNAPGKWLTASFAKTLKDS